MNFEDQPLFEAFQYVLARALPSTAPPIRFAAKTLFSSMNDFPLASLCNCMHKSERMVMTGVALDLIRVGFRRLHTSVDRADAQDFDCGTGAKVLLGDYLSTGAFKLMVELGDLNTMRLVSDAVTTTCEKDAYAIGTVDVAFHEKSASAPLGFVAGVLGATAAGYKEPRVRLYGTAAQMWAETHALLDACKRLHVKEALLDLLSVAQASCVQASARSALLAEFGRPKPFSPIEKSITYELRNAHMRARS